MAKTNENELWAPVVVKGVTIPGYSVSDLGRVKSTAGPIATVETCSKKNGRAFLDFGWTGEFLHRLVAQAFVPKLDPAATDVIFVDRDPSNCRFDNLAWATHGVAVRLAIASDPNPSRFQSTQTPVFGTWPDGTVVEFPSHRHASKYLGKDIKAVPNISRATRDKKPYLGVTWSRRHGVPAPLPTGSATCARK